MGSAYASRAPHRTASRASSGRTRCASVTDVGRHGGASRPAASAASSRTAARRNVTATGPKIIGGRNARPGEFPYQVSVRYGSSHFCGGAILNATTVVTAAHCVYKKPQAFLRQLSVMAGSVLMSQPGAIVDVQSVLVHPDYGAVYQEYDIALLYLTGPLPLRSDIWPVRLQENEIPAGAACVASGWGRTVDDERAPLPDALQAVDLPIIDAKTCNDMYSEDYDYSPVIESQICAGYVEGSKDSCQGDSGGPLVCTSQQLLTGIVSWGAGCAQPGFPGVYSDVAFLLPWIKENVVLDGRPNPEPVPQPVTPRDTTTGDAARPAAARTLSVLFALAVAALGV
ncbi:Trypsin-7 [Frankliniella fusca]|uniref:Trypsin-7 n=1 Tax=Frankliniella fusca TaxID=407009 RepID=A0AAE1LFD3_9NEOP|nr:Trypsin-7 [Frankliniella fusca]